MNKKHLATIALATAITYATFTGTAEAKSLE